MAYQVIKGAYYDEIPKMCKATRRKLYKNNFVLYVCPNCGKEQMVRWNMMDFEFWGDDYETKKQYKKQWDFDRIQNLLVADITKYLINENATCCCCDSKLTTKIGYFFQNIRWRDSPINHLTSIVDACDNNTLYKMNNLEAQQIKKYSQAPIQTEKPFLSYYNVGIYSFNDIADEYRLSHDTVAYNSDSVDNCQIVPLFYIEDKNLPFWDKHQIFANKAPYCLTIDQLFELLCYYREKIAFNEGSSVVNDIIQDERNRANVGGESTQINTEVDNSMLRKYLYNLIQVETDIYSLTQRLPFLYFVRKEYNRSKKQIMSTKEEQEQIVIGRRRLNEAEEHLRLLQNDPSAEEQKYNLKVSKLEKIHYPTEPIKPSEPILEKPGLFNKKMVIAENERRVSIYKQELIDWEEKVQQYKEETERLQQLDRTQREHARALAKQEIMQDIEAAEIAVKNAEANLKKAEGKLAQKEQINTSLVNDDIWYDEIRTAEETLRKCVETQVKLEKCNIVFPKYRNLVAYSSFYEYLESGRCDALQGPTGAYNMYETEIRQNLVISQLSNIVDSLEEIKNNQYMVYSQLQEVNSNLGRLNRSMDSLLSEVKTISATANDIRSYAKEIAENTKAIAYNTEATAYYSSINAELTDALGYLIAMK